ncbi:DUF1145 domain-containing protein [Zestomonas carbonaria]|uniref:DUF1145 domain-containing protein n=1 Tax=Zestomonas carbonaria TaxID=2762745 RepID=A0A7U7IAC4_9GAMM|nr:DUF1145 domain-containing protein [Pseudomonas carbonaria]CAD5109225.1 hypothetical protein PSEWESI4_03521 [Pseudomonas carbonaria]
MKIFLGMGKALALLFWLVVLANLLKPFAQPFAGLLHLAGGSLLLLHVLELMLFGARLNGGLERLQVLAFGILHLFAQPRIEPAGVVEDVALTEEVSHA